MVNVRDYIDESYKLLINGEFVDAESGETLKTYSPSTGEELATFAKAGQADVDKAVSAAQEAFKTWSKTSLQERQALLHKIADKIEENADRIAYAESMDNGKVLRESTGIDIPLGTDHFRYFAGVPRTELGTVTEMDENTMSLVTREPIGVVGAVVAWNFPFLLASWKLAPALAAGCTIVIQPSSSTPLSMLELANIMQEVLPKGVVNILTGKGSESGDMIFNHEGVDKLSFTGSTEVGYSVADAGAKRLVPATLELGGKSANIIFDDANFEQALEGAQIGILFNQGQVCSAGSRVLVQEGIYDKFVDALVKKFEDIKIGNPLEEGSILGSITSEGQLKKIMGYMDTAKEEGCKILTGGERVTGGEFDKGFYFKPTIIEVPNNSVTVAQEEIFGPVITVQKFSTKEEAIDIANDSIYGLAGGVFSTNINTALDVARNVRTGRMWVNTYNQVPSGAPFGGYKKSGIGRETYKDAIANFQQTKNIYINTLDAPMGLYE